MKSMVTSKHGDAGETAALSGERLSKTHPIMECTGTLDELRAHTALVRQFLLHSATENHSPSPEQAEISTFLLWLLHLYFLIGSQISDPLNRKPGSRVADLCAQHLARLEQEQERLEQGLALPKAFIVSASNPVAAQADIACTVARRFERRLVTLKEAVPEFEASLLLSFVNRLSDYLFVLARHLENGTHEVVDYDLLR